MYYDPMLAKLIVWGRDRPAAIDRMKRALRELTLTGIRNNIAFFVQVMRHPAFLAGEYDTGYIERYQGTELRLGDGHHVEVALLAAAIAAHRRERDLAARAEASSGGSGTEGRSWGQAHRLTRLGREA